MNILEALSLFGYTSIDEVREDALKKKFRLLMKANHPDLFRNSEQAKKAEENSKLINEANELLLKVAKEISEIEKIEKASKREEIMAIIPFEELFELYKGKSVKLKSGNDIFELTSSNIRAHRIVLRITCSVLVGGIKQEYSTYKLAVLNDKYDIECDIPVVDASPIQVTVYAYGKEVNVNISSMVTKLRLQYESSVSLTVSLNKKIISDN